MDRDGQRGWKRDAFLWNIGYKHGIPQNETKHTEIPVTTEHLNN